MKTLKLQYTLERETKRTVRYAATEPERAGATHTIYVSKEIVGTPYPKALHVEISWEN